MPDPPEVTNAVNEALARLTQYFQRAGFTESQANQLAVQAVTSARMYGVGAQPAIKQDILNLTQTEPSTVAGSDVGNLADLVDLVGDGPTGGALVDAAAGGGNGGAGAAVDADGLADAAANETAGGAIDAIMDLLPLLAI